MKRLASRAVSEAFCSGTAHRASRRAGSLRWLPIHATQFGAVAAWLIAACSADPTTRAPEPPRDPAALTFVTADGTLASIGWTGLFHNIRGARGTSFSARVTSCNNGVCQFQGTI